MMVAPHTPSASVVQLQEQASRPHDSPVTRVRTKALNHRAGVRARIRAWISGVGVVRAGILEL